MSMTATRTLTITIQDPLVILTNSLPLGAVGQPYGPLTLSAQGGVLPYSWSATGLLAGLTCSSAGVISGTPTASGSDVSVVLSVTDSTP